MVPQDLRGVRQARSIVSRVPCEYEMRGYGGNKLMKRLQVQARDVGINCKKDEDPQVRRKRDDACA